MLQLRPVRRGLAGKAARPACNVLSTQLHSIDATGSELGIVMARQAGLDPEMSPLAA